MRLYRARIGGDAGEALRAARAELGGNWERSLSADVRALTLSILGTAEYWADELSSSLRHLQEAAGLARDYLATNPDPSLHAFLRLNFAQLERRHGAVMGIVVPRPKMVPLFG